MSIPATAGAAPTAPAPETIVSIKLSLPVDGTNRKFKLPLRDLVAPVFADKIRSIIQVPETQRLLLERFSDSGNAFVPLEATNASAYKQLYRAGKAKQKLKLRATLLALAPKLEAQQDPEIIKSTQQNPRFPSSHNHSHSQEVKKMSGIAHLAGSAGRASFFQNLAGGTTNLEEEFKHLMNDTHRAAVGGVWQVFCNNCDKPMNDAHYHCSICDDGDYDLCQSCVTAGAGCQGEEHWLIKRFISDGKVVNSTTETIAPRSARANEAPRKQEMPGSFNIEPLKSTARKPEHRTKIDVASLLNASTRTCNACVQVLPEEQFITCADCPDVDYCVPCLKKNDQGHHPGHRFKPAVQGTASTFDNEVHTLSKANRNIKHAALCDECDESIFGVRHKCLTCPDFDCCSKCIETTEHKKSHRFVPVYEPLPLAVGPTNETRHRGIFCDGPLCGKSGQHQSYITGVRYKCAICPDFDLCASCEAHPDTKHNVTHPMIKFKTAIRGVSVSTYDDQMPCNNAAPLGDILPFRTAPSYAIQRNASTTTLPVYTPAAAAVSKPNPPQYAASPAMPIVKELEGHFIRDTIADGTTFTPDTNFQQKWTVRNPGPQTWSAGVAVVHVGGDNMLDLDRNRPVSVADLGIAQKSNVTTESIYPGQEVTFTVDMRAPTREGKHISYWRLRAGDGIYFGHKLWCDIEVKGSKQSLMAVNSLPADVSSSLDSSAIYDADAHRHAADRKADQWSMGFAKRQEASSLQADALKEKLALYMQKVEEITAQAAAEKAALTTEKTTAARQPTVEDEAESKLKESQVIMPKLERDGSPSASASMHDLPAATQAEKTTVSETTGEDTDLDELADVNFESADAGSVIDDEDDGFLTDEEYDILDASEDEVRGM